MTITSIAKLLIFAVFTVRMLHSAEPGRIDMLDNLTIADLSPTEKKILIEIYYSDSGSIPADVNKSLIRHAKFVIALQNTDIFWTNEGFVYPSLDAAPIFDQKVYRLAETLSVGELSAVLLPDNAHKVRIAPIYDRNDRIVLFVVGRKTDEDLTPGRSYPYEYFAVICGPDGTPSGPVMMF